MTFDIKKEAKKYAEEFYFNKICHWKFPEVLKDEILINLERAFEEAIQQGYNAGEHEDCKAEGY